MKNILKYILIGSVGLSTFTSCVTEEEADFKPSPVVMPTLAGTHAFTDLDRVIFSETLPESYALKSADFVFNNTPYAMTVAGTDISLNETLATFGLDTLSSVSGHIQLTLSDGETISFPTTLSKTQAIALSIPSNITRNTAPVKFAFTTATKNAEVSNIEVKSALIPEGNTTSWNKISFTEKTDLNNVEKDSTYETGLSYMVNDTLAYVMTAYSSEGLMTTDTMYSVVKEYLVGSTMDFMLDNETNYFSFDNMAAADTAYFSDLVFELEEDELTLMGMQVSFVEGVNLDELDYMTEGKLNGNLLKEAYENATGKKTVLSDLANNETFLFKAMTKTGAYIYGVLTIGDYIVTTINGAETKEVGLSYDYIVEDWMEM